MAKTIYPVVEVTSKQYLPLLTAVQKVTGIRPHLSTVLRWCTTGAHGRVLQSAKIGGRRLCTIEAVQAFIEVTEPPTQNLSVPKDRSNQVNKAVEQLGKRTRSES